MGKSRCRISTCIAAMAVMVVLGVCIGIPLAAHKAKESNARVAGAFSLCQVTSYVDMCNETLAGGANHSAASVTMLTMQAASTGVNRTREAIFALNSTTQAAIFSAVHVCRETLAMAQEHTAAAMTLLQSLNSTSRHEALHTIKARMSAAMELHSTCVEAVKEEDVYGDDGEGLSICLAQAARTDKVFSNALAFVNALEKYGQDLSSWKSTVFSSLGDLHVPSEIIRVGSRKLLTTDGWMGTDSDYSFPAWMRGETEEHLLQGNWYDVVVAKDGSGNFDTIQAAVDAHAVNSARVVIYVKAGIYIEQVNVASSCLFLSIVGDGDATVVTGSRSVASMPGMQTFYTATLIVAAEGFIGKSFKVENTAGAEGQQAVAVRVSADQVAFYQVTFDSFQDTLYAHVGRQYYRDCTIIGTVDFIFGNAAAAFQSCTILARKTTLIGQQNTYTAQGRTDPHQSTGLSFQNCNFDGTPELKANTALCKTYLGRPWKPYSVSVVMKSELQGHIDPQGWLPWNASTFGLYTSYFAEYQNFGDGAASAARVPWSHQIAVASVALQYTAHCFLHAGYWMQGYGIPLTDNL